MQLSPPESEPFELENPHRLKELQCGLAAQIVQNAIERKRLIELNRNDWRDVQERRWQSSHREEHPALYDRLLPLSALSATDHLRSKPDPPPIVRAPHLERCTAELRPEQERLTPPLTHRVRVPRLRRTAIRAPWKTASLSDSQCQQPPFTCREATARPRRAGQRTVNPFYMVHRTELLTRHEPLVDEDRHSPNMAVATCTAERGTFEYEGTVQPPDMPLTARMPKPPRVGNQRAGSQPNKVCVATSLALDTRDPAQTSRVIVESSSMLHVRNRRGPPAPRRPRVKKKMLSSPRADSPAAQGALGFGLPELKPSNN